MIRTILLIVVVIFIFVFGFLAGILSYSYKDDAEIQLRDDEGQTEYLAKWAEAHQKGVKKK